MAPDVTVRRWGGATAGDGELHPVRWKSRTARSGAAAETASMTRSTSKGSGGARPGWQPRNCGRSRPGAARSDFFAQGGEPTRWVELRRSTLEVYRCLWEAHAEPGLAGDALRGHRRASRRVVPGRAAGGRRRPASSRRWRRCSASSATRSGTAKWRSTLEGGAEILRLDPPARAHPFTPLEVERLSSTSTSRLRDEAPCWCASWRTRGYERHLEQGATRTPARPSARGRPGG